MANLGKIVYLSTAQKDTLFANGSVTVGGTTITYSANDLYLTPETSDIADFVSFTEDQTSRTDAEKAQARDNIGASGDWTLLWTNASPSSDFAAQTVSLALTPYSDILIIADQYKNANIHLPFYCRVDGYRYLEVVGTFDESGTMTLNRRQATISTSGIVFTEAYSKTFNSSSKSAHNDQLIPLYIYAR